MAAVSYASVGDPIRLPVMSAAGVYPSVAGS